MIRQIRRNRKLTAEEAEKYRKIREDIEMEKPAIIVKAQQARREARRKQLAAVMQSLQAAREAKGLSLADVHEQTGIDRSALSKLENVTNDRNVVPLRRNRREAA